MEVNLCEFDYLTAKYIRQSGAQQSDMLLRILEHDHFRDLHATIICEDGRNT